MRNSLFVSLFLLPAVVFSQAPQPTSRVTVDSSDRARILLNDSLKDKNPETRKHAVQSLGLASATEPWLTQLEAMLDDKDVEVRVAAVTSLVDLKSERTVTSLKKALNSDVPEVSFAAAKALWTLDDPSGREALLSILSGETKSRSGFVNREKRDALRMLHTPRTTFLFALVEGSHFAPVPGLGAGISSLQGILSDASVSGRAATALLLSTEKSPEILRALQDALADSDWTVRAAAVHAIAIRNDPALQPDLIPMMEDKKEAVRVRAAAGYLRLQAIKSKRAGISEDRPSNPPLPLSSEK